MENQPEIFKPGIAELTKMADSYKGMVINGLSDKAGYEAVKAARKSLGDVRVFISKTGKKLREEALEKQRRVLRDEKKYLAIIVPTEEILKAKLVAIDEEKKTKEREILLPIRQKMLDEIGVKFLDAEILRMDEKEFSEYYGAEMNAYKEKQAEIAREKEAKAAREAEMEAIRLKASEDAKKQAEKDAKEKARKAAEKVKQDKIDAENFRLAELDRVEKEKQAEIDKLKQDKIDKELAEEKAIQDEAERKHRLKIEMEKQAKKLEKSKKYQAWLAKNEWEDNGDFIIQEDCDTDTHTMYKKISTLKL